MFMDNPCIIDDVPLIVNDSNLAATINPDQFAPGGIPGIYGYIEFVTAADNIKM